MGAFNDKNQSLSSAVIHLIIDQIWLEESQTSRVASCLIGASKISSIYWLYSISSMHLSQYLSCQRSLFTVNSQ